MTVLKTEGLNEAGPHPLPHSTQMDDFILLTGNAPLPTYQSVAMNELATSPGTVLL